MATQHYWLVKTEPSTYSIQDLAAEPRQTTCWDGVRNYQARNYMRDQMVTGDGVLIYHSNADPPAVAGTAVVAKPAYPDFTAFDPRDPHYDPKSDPQNPRWFMVDIKLKSVFPHPVGLPRLRDVKSLAKMELLRKGSRLSVQPVRKSEFDAIVKLAQQKK